MKRRLFWRIYLHGFALLVLVCAAILLIGSTFRGGREWQDLHVGIAHHLSEQTAPLIDRPEALHDELRRLREVLHVDLSYYDLNGKLIASNVQPPLEGLAAHEMGELDQGAHCTSSSMWHVVAPVGDGGSYLVLEDSVREAKSRTEDFVLIAAILLVLALSSIPLARAIARPLEKLTTAVRKLGSGDLSVRSGVRRRDEVGELAKAFDEMAERLESLVRRERELLANVSHELRTPLARLRVAIDLGSEGDIHSARQCLKEMGTDLDDLDRLIADLLTAARLDLASGPSGPTGVIRRENVEARDLIELAAKRFRAAHPERHLELRLEGAAAMHLDRELIRRAIDNLLDNARKYSEPDAPIALSAELSDGLKLAVRDQGIGIDSEDLPRLFTPFFRTDRSRARGTGGVGLGLALVKRMIEAHGGSIAVESKPGDGTTVRFVIPAG